MLSAVTDRIRTRIEQRRAVVSDRGDIMMEAIICMAVIGICLLGYIGVNLNANESQRVAIVTDATAQAAKGLLEEFDSRQWNNVAMWTGDYSSATYPDPNYAASSGRNLAVVRATGTNRPSGVRASGTHTQDPNATPGYAGGPVTIGNVQVSMQAYVVWSNSTCPNASCPSSISTASSYGAKQLIVVATPTGYGRSFAPRTYSFILTPPLNEASPTSLPASR